MLNTMINSGSETDEPIIKSKIEIKLYESIKRIFLGHNFYKARPRWLTNPTTNTRLEVDFFCKELKLIIEMQKHRNYVYYDDLYDNQEPHVEQLEINKLKRTLCYNQGFTLVIFCDHEEYNFVRLLSQIKKDISMGIIKSIYDFTQNPQVESDRRICCMCGVITDLDDFAEQSEFQKQLYVIHMQVRSCKDPDKISKLLDEYETIVKDYARELARKNVDERELHQ
jgi:hypothetical protein